MRPEGNNFAFIDSQNLNLNIRREGWILDLGKFIKYIREKYGVRKAFIFIGYVKSNERLYIFLRETGFEVIFKPTTYGLTGHTKGNVDAELVLHAMIQYENFDQAVVVTGDGDFHCLVEYLLEKNKFNCLLAPTVLVCSTLLKKLCVGKIDFVSNLKNQLVYKKSPK